MEQNKSIPVVYFYDNSIDTNHKHYKYYHNAYNLPDDDPFSEKLLEKYRCKHYDDEIDEDQSYQFNFLNRLKKNSTIKNFIKQWIYIGGSSDNKKNYFDYCIS